MEIPKVLVDQVTEIIENYRNEHEINLKRSEGLFTGDKLYKQKLFLRRVFLSHTWRTMKQMGLV